jgi:predicted sulfurtransferase
LEAYPDGGFFRGRLLVFDERLSVGPPGSEGAAGAGACAACAAPYGGDYSGGDRCASCRMLILLCDACAAARSAAAQCTLCRERADTARAAV